MFAHMELCKLETVVLFSQEPQARVIIQSGQEPHSPAWLSTPAYLFTGCWVNWKGDGLDGNLLILPHKCLEKCLTGSYLLTECRGIVWGFFCWCSCISWFGTRSHLSGISTFYSAQVKLIFRDLFMFSLFLYHCLLCVAHRCYDQNA